jgi:hypothetical protein
VTREAFLWWWAQLESTTADGGEGSSPARALPLSPTWHPNKVARRRGVATGRRIREGGERAREAAGLIPSSTVSLRSILRGQTLLSTTCTPFDPHPDEVDPQRLEMETRTGTTTARPRRGAASEGVADGRRGGCRASEGRRRIRRRGGGCRASGHLRQRRLQC